MTIVFWGLLAVVVYGYFGYPLLVAVVGRFMNRRVDMAPITPPLSVIIAAYDEEEGIVDRVRNALDSTYPADRIEVVVASDGSSDRTVELASGVDPTRVQVLDLPRRGKAAALADAVRRARGEVLVFTDANTMFAPDALVMLSRNLADPEVGGVAGRVGYRVPSDGESAGRGEDLYWRYDTWIRTLESRTGSVVSAHGGMYAIRRSLFRPVEDASVTDDFAISTAIVDQGYRLIFEPAARGWEQTMVRSGSEFRRRVRLMTRGLWGVVLRRNLLNPFGQGFYAVALGSRKLLRRVLPLAFPVLFVVSAILARDSGFFGAVWAAQVTFLVLAGAGWLLRSGTLGRAKLLYVPFFFCLANLAALAALGNVIRGNRIERWTPHRHQGGVPFTAEAGGS